jgi:hypothetical protein
LSKTSNRVLAYPKNAAQPHNPKPKFIFHNLKPPLTYF